MAAFYGYDLQYVATGGDLDNATILQTAKEGIVSKIKNYSAPFVQSDDINPAKVLSLGTVAEIRAVLVAHSLDIFSAMFGTSIITDSGNGIKYTEIDQTPTEKALYDCQYYIKSAETEIEYHKFTKMFLNADLNLIYKQGNVFYLPLIFKTTKGSTIRFITNI